MQVWVSHAEESYALDAFRQGITNGFYDTYRSSRDRLHAIFRDNAGVPHVHRKSASPPDQAESVARCSDLGRLAAGN